MLAPSACKVIAVGEVEVTTELPRTKRGLAQLVHF